VQVCRVIVGLGFSLIECLQKLHENLSVSSRKSIAAEINKSSQVSSANTREFEKARGSVRKSESVTRLPSARIIRYDAINAQAS
jgi:hypothetical protein